MASFKDGREKRVDGDLDEVPRDAVMFGGLEALHECLFGYRLPNGTDRPGMKISIWAKNGRVKVCLNDEEAGMVGFGDLDPGMPLGAALNLLFVEGPVDWAVNKYFRKK